MTILRREGDTHVVGIWNIFDDDERHQCFFLPKTSFDVSVSTPCCQQILGCVLNVFFQSILVSKHIIRILVKQFHSLSWLRYMCFYQP